MDATRTATREPRARAVPMLLRPPVLALLVLGGLFLVLFVYAWSHPLTSDAPSVLDPLRFQAAEEEHVRMELRDPDSARFREEFVSENRPLLVICGEVNQKNDTGGYAGYQRFISGPKFLALEGPAGEDVMKELWSDLCRRKP